MSRAPDTDRCPVCGEDYAELLVVERGDRWGDLYPGSAFSFFKRYRRRCTARRDVDRERDLPEDERAVYFHADRDGASAF